MITVDQVRFSYGDGLVLDQVGLHVPDSSVLGVVGPNGCGKTTLLRTLYASLEPDGGSVLLDDAEVGALGPREVARRAAVVVQETPGELPFTVADMVLLGRTPHRRGFAGADEHDHRIAAAALHRVGARHLADRVFAGLSGGEKQRVLIARAIAQQVDHLLLDEPTNHLDIRYQHEVLQLVRSLDATTVVVLHDLNLAARYCDQVLVLAGGRVVRAGTPDEVLTPEVLEPVYGIRVRRLRDGDDLQLLFSPYDRPRHDSDVTDDRPAPRTLTTTTARAM